MGLTNQGTSVAADVELHHLARHAEAEAKAAPLGPHCHGRRMWRWLLRMAWQWSPMVETMTGPTPKGVCLGLGSSGCSGGSTEGVMLHPLWCRRRRAGKAKENPVRSTIESALLGPLPSGPLPRKGIAPCSCSKYTMKLARNPYTQHQKRARSFPVAFFVKNDAELQAGFGRGDLVRVPTVGRGLPLDRLTHSEPFLLPAAFEVLKEMASRFAQMPWRAHQTKGRPFGSPA